MANEVKLRIHNQEELYQPYDPDCMSLNPDVIEYLEQQLKKLHPRDKTALRIVSEEEVEQGAVRALFRRFLEEENKELGWEKS